MTAYGDKIPKSAEYFASGGFNSEEKARSAWPEGSVEPGGTYKHTFKATGEYQYFCIPHEDAGMTGSMTVQKGGASSGGSSGPSVPDRAKTLGIAVVSFMLSTLGIAYFFMKYGGDYVQQEE